MNKKLFLLGVVTMGLLLLGSLPAVAPEPDPVGSDPFGDLNGAVDLSYDLSLTHVGTPQSSTPTGLTNQIQVQCQNLWSMAHLKDLNFL
ncbi:MAG: hypothetical protein ACW98W_11355 [Candidatus Hodarchaeales archaeon]|jgi:hypothetical protein